MFQRRYVYKLHASLNDKVAVDEHGCHTALKFSFEAKENKDNFLRYIGYLNSIKTYTAIFIADSSSSTTTKLYKLLSFFLTAIKSM